MSDVHELTAAQQLRALRAKELSSHELTTHYLERIDQLEPTVGAFEVVLPELALREADAADAARARGVEAPLLGLPLAVKDLHLAAGVPTTLGSAAVRVVPEVDGWTVGLLRRAGSVLLGTTRASELGATCFTEEADGSRPVRTPFGLDSYASGSSAGAAVAVAAGLVPVAHASDGAGSIRTPAATCHLVGFKPSRGLVSAAPTTSFMSPGTEGPIARTVGDAALLLDVMAQTWPGDLHAWSPAGSFLDAAAEDPARLRVAVCTDTGVDGLQPHRESQVAVDRAVQLLVHHGHDVETLTLPARLDDAVHEALVLTFASSVQASLAALVAPEDRALLTPYTRFLLDVAHRLTATDVVRSQAVLASYASAFLAATAPFDVVLTPTTSGPPVPLGHFTEAGAEQVSRRMLAWSCHTPWANLTGQPAVSLPSHLDADGLPHAVQLVGRPRTDLQLLSLSAQLERAALWRGARPDVWDQA